MSIGKAAGFFIGMLTLQILAAGGTAMATEEPAYKVIKDRGDFELRRYDSFVVAETVVDGGFSDASYKAFRVLFDYIDGNNQRKESIAMTAPVNQEPGGEKIDMTAPVTQEPRGRSSGGEYVVGFVLPAKYDLSNAPEPNDPRVTLREVPARVMAARGYSGSWGKRKYARNEKALLAGLAREGIEIIGDPVFARYNSPFTAWWNRRNEVLIEVEWKD